MQMIAKVTVNRSGKMVYLIHNQQKKIYSVQCIEQNQK